MISSSIIKNSLDRCLDFLNESNKIESISEIDYHSPEYQVEDKGHYGAFLISQQQAEGHAPLNIKVICQWQKLLTEEQLIHKHHIETEEIGHIRSAQNPKDVRVGNHVPPHYENVPTLIDALLEKINEGLQDQEKLKADEEYVKFLGSNFLKFMKIHPFADGNGRTGRLLANYIATYCKRPIILFNAEMSERNIYYDAHDSEQKMWMFIANKVQDTIFSSPINGGVLMLKEKEMTGASACYTALNPQEPEVSEVREWHSLRHSMEDWVVE